MKNYAFVAAAALVPFCGHGQNINSVLSEWSVITSGNLQAFNDIQGSAYVGGNLTAGNSCNVATDESGVSQSTVTLAVAGNVTAGGNIQVNAGHAVVGGTITGRTFNMNSGAAAPTSSGSASLPSSPVGIVTSASHSWSALANNSLTSVNAAGQLNFNCNSGAALSVFNLTASSLFNSGYQGFCLNPSSSTAEVIINVSGSTADWTTGSFFGSFNTASWDGRVIFNFYNATSVTLSGLMGGYVVAPNANVTEENNIDGGVMAANLTVDSEVDLPCGSATPWDGNVPASVPAPVPEPASWVSAIGLLMLLAAGIARDSRRLAVVRLKRGGGSSTHSVEV